MMAMASAGILAANKGNEINVRLASALHVLLVALELPSSPAILGIFSLVVADAIVLHAGHEAHPGTLVGRRQHLRCKPKEGQ